jgi:hypothetical protein
MALDKRKLGKDHPDTLSLMHNLTDRYCGLAADGGAGAGDARVYHGSESLRLFLYLSTLPEPSRL